MSEAMVSDAPADLAAPALDASRGGVALGAGSSMRPDALEASGSGGAMEASKGDGKGDGKAEEIGSDPIKDSRKHIPSEAMGLLKVMGTEFSDMQIEVWSNKEKAAKLTKEVQEMEEDVSCYPSDYRRYKPK
eukprot:5256404-Karenia_brevis.AAC.1